MKSLKWILPLLALTIALGGCPYGSKQFIDNPTVAVDAKLLGKWETTKGTAKTFTVTKIDAYTYSIASKTTQTGETTEYKAFESNVEGDRFLNIKENNSQDGKYYFYRIKLGADYSKIILQPVTENIDEVFNTPEELKAYIAKNKSLSFFFDRNEEVYIKVN